MNFIDQAAKLDEAAVKATAVPQISTEGSFSEDEAYLIQKASIDRRLRRGETLVGLKMGFTSYAKMEQMGVHDMIWGRLTSSMNILNGQTIQLSNYIHPRSEPEIAFRISKDINSEITSIDELMTYVSGVAAAIEIIDSRFENFKFSLEDVIADNCSSTGFVLGRWCDPKIELTNLSMSMSFNGKKVAEGNSSAILNNPWDALKACTRLAAKYNQRIPENSIVLAGAATAAKYLESKVEVEVEVEKLGYVNFKCI